MAIRSDIDDDDHWFTNEDKSLVFTIYQSNGTTVQNLTGWPLVWMLKRKQWDADANALITKTGPGSPTQIAVPAPLTGVATVPIYDTDTVALPAGTYYHELKRDEPGLETVLSFGTAKLKHSIHRS